MSRINSIEKISLRWENKTSHPIGRLNEVGELIDVLPASRFAIRVDREFVPDYQADGSLVGTFVGQPTFKNMPDPIRQDTIYVVSGVAAQLIRRWNFVAPRTYGVGADRDHNGDMRAVARFVHYAQDGVP